MKAKDEKGFTLKQHVTLILRAVKIYAGLPAPIILAKTLDACVSAVVPFISLYFSAQILGELASQRDGARLLKLVLLAIGFTLAATLIRSLLRRWNNYSMTAFWPAIESVFTQKLFSMDYVDIEDPKVQQAFSTIMQHQNGMGYGLPRIRHAVAEVVGSVIQIAVSVAFAFTLFSRRVPDGSAMAYLDHPLAVVLIILVLIGSMLLAPHLSNLGGRIQVKMADENSRLNRFFGFYFFQLVSTAKTAKDIRIYDQNRLIRKASVWRADAWEHYAALMGRYDASSAAVTYLANGLIYLYVALKALGGAFGVGGIVQYVGAITQFGNGVSSLLTNIGKLLNNNAFLEKMFEFLDIPNRKYQGTLSVEKRDDNEYEIEFHNVSFRYPGQEGEALKNVNLKLHIGERLAVVGMNGSGKTTMIKLLCRLYDPTEGVITLNGIDIQKYNYDEYMAIFSVVFQDFQLLPFTLGQNVAASTQVDMEKATRALEQAGFAARMQHMPKGLDTYLYKTFEEEGVEISGGEAQKIALARALYKDAPFIILDEPTAALDPVAEAEIYERFNEFVEEKTAIYISHRLSSCRFCQDIAVFDEGKLVQRGSHETLVEDREGKYYQLWHAQAQYYQHKAG